MVLNNATWRKSSFSSDNGGHCVEAASLSGAVAIRDSKDPSGPKLLVDRAAFRRFASAIKDA